MVPLSLRCYAPIVASFVEIVGEDCVQGTYGSPDFDWQTRKTKQVRDLYHEHPDQVWVLVEAGQVFGYVTFDLVPGRRVGFFDNNGVLSERRGQGWGTFTYRHVLQHFRERGNELQNSVDAFFAGQMKTSHIPGVVSIFSGQGSLSRAGHAGAARDPYLFNEPFGVTLALIRAARA